MFACRNTLLVDALTYTWFARWRRSSKRRCTGRLPSKKTHVIGETLLKPACAVKLFNLKLVLGEASQTKIQKATLSNDMINTYVSHKSPNSKRHEILKDFSRVGHKWTFPGDGLKHFSRGATLVRFHFTNSKPTERYFSTEKWKWTCLISKSRGDLGRLCNPFRPPRCVNNTIPTGSPSWRTNIGESLILSVTCCLSSDDMQKILVDRNFSCIRKNAEKQLSFPICFGPN